MRKGNYIEAGKRLIRKNDRYDMSFAEMRMFIDTAVKKDIFSAIGDAFYMGVETGKRIEERKAEV